MPIVKSSSKLIFYAHIPKCAGSSVGQYLEERFGTIGLIDNYYSLRPEVERWSNTSPQHIDWKNLQTIIPMGMIDVYFTVVRHPVSRIVSAFVFQRDVEKSISLDITFSDWLVFIRERIIDYPFLYDNHLRPQVDFLPDNCTIFYLEHGLDAIVPFLDEVVGSVAGPRALGHENKSRYSQRRSKKSTSSAIAPPKPTQDDLELIGSLYEDDFNRLNYQIDKKMPLAEMPTTDDAHKLARDQEISRRNFFFYRFSANIQRRIKRRLILRQIKVNSSKRK